MKLLLLAAMAGTAAADPFATDAPPDHTVYNCDKVRQDVDEANDKLGDGVCDPEVNCGPFSYDLGDCWDSADDVCLGDSWYSTGRPNFRCSTKTGGIRLGRAGSNDDTGVAKHDSFTTPCDCYTECLAIAAKAGEPLVAFDHYSGKCRCWSGTCDASDTGSLPCFNGGDDYGEGGPNDGGLGEGPDGGNNWRCPSEIYFPELKYDCDGNDITFRYPNLEQYIGDGFCDDGLSMNQQFAASSTSEDAFNLNCEAFNYDGGDCELDCHESIYWATGFVDLNSPFWKIDECTQGSADATTAWTTACACYEFCADAINDDAADFLFDHDDAGNCRCWSSVGDHDATLASIAADSGDETFCGLNSDCQIYQPNRFHDCQGDDYTLGVYDGSDTYNATDIGEEVESWTAYTGSSCIEEAMCLENSFSQGNCFDCERFSTSKETDTYCDGGIEFDSISNDDLDTLISDGYLMGVDVEDTSTGGDNCACLNYCFSTLVSTGIDSETVHDYFNTIAEFDFAYAQYNNTCVCYESCENTLPCGTTGGDCPATSTLWYSTVSDLNTLV